VFIVIKLNGLLVVKHKHGLIEGDPMLSPVFAVLPFIPLKTQLTHNYTVNIESREVNQSLIAQRYRSPAAGRRASARLSVVWCDGLFKGKKGLKKKEEKRDTLMILVALQHPFFACDEMDS